MHTISERGGWHLPRGPQPLLPGGTIAARVGSVVVQMVRHAAATLVLWQQRARQRRALASLDARILSDIGLSWVDVELEARKPFWRA